MLLEEQYENEYIENLSNPEPITAILTTGQYLVSQTPDVMISPDGLTCEYRSGRPMCPRA